MKILILCLLVPVLSLAQNKGDSKIIIALADTAGIYDRIKLALVKADFIVKELNSRDSITTYPRELKTMSGFAIAHAIIKDGEVVINGFYTRRKISYYGVIKTSKDVKPIVHYRSSKLWALLMKVATDIGGEIKYSK